jgi:hypothetical protein
MALSEAMVTTIRAFSSRSLATCSASRFGATDDDAGVQRKRSSLSINCAGAENA